MKPLTGNSAVRADWRSGWRPGWRRRSVWRRLPITLAVLACRLALVTWADPLPSPTLAVGLAEFVQAGGADIVVPGYSVPTLTHWDNDGLLDLVVGEGVAEFPGKVRVYLNVGSATSPQFADFFYAQARGGDLTVPAEGCMGAFPRVVQWDGDGRKDLLVGRADGTVQIFLNTATDDTPSFDSGTYLAFGDPGEEEPIDVFYRATPCVTDWNDDGRKDLVIGSVDGLIYLFINAGTDTAPQFLAVDRVQMYDESYLTVPGTRSSPDVVDLDGDGDKDLLVGDRLGQLLFFSNCASDAAPAFAPYSLVYCGGAAIDLPGLPRSRPFVCDWTGDGQPDVLVGSADGTVRLYQALHLLGDIEPDQDVDWDDAAALLGCESGPTVAPPSGCGAADLDLDADVDLADVALMQAAFRGTACGD